MRFTRKSNWRPWVTPRPSRKLPIHRWYVFPHSFAPQLAHQLIDDWGLGKSDLILDPFAGAGTTLLAAKEKGVPSCGYDISPLAVLVSRVKATSYKNSRLEKAWSKLSSNLKVNVDAPSKNYPDLIKEALPGKLLAGFDSILSDIDHLSCSSAERDLFRLALLSTLPHYSRAVASGGWLKWISNPTRVTSLISSFRSSVEAMLVDHLGAHLNYPRCDIAVADARRLPDRTRKYSAVITSPPYPNRHDYTRVFGVELMLAFLSWDETRTLRYQSFHSHPEAHPRRRQARGYKTPTSLIRVLELMRNRDGDDRIPDMLEGYFLDMYLCLREIARVCRSKARVALVVGNAQYEGRPVYVDKLTAEIGEQVGLHCEKLVIARYRGNSAQQMGVFGRRRSRETVVIFQKY